MSRYHMALALDFFFEAGETAKFYADYRWQGWEQDVKGLPGDKGFLFVPFLWTKADSLESRFRGPVPLAELYGLQQNT